MQIVDYYDDVEDTKEAMARFVKSKCGLDIVTARLLSSTYFYNRVEKGLSRKDSRKRTLKTYKEVHTKSWWIVPAIRVAIWILDWWLSRRSKLNRYKNREDMIRFKEIEDGQP